jgi:hypothetical protein
MVAYRLRTDSLGGILDAGSTRVKHGMAWRG